MRCTFTPSGNLHVSQYQNFEIIMRKVKLLKVVVNTLITIFVLDFKLYAKYFTKEFKLSSLYVYLIV